LNESLDTQLQIRVGVNTDGPLIAGVLGTEKPVFDIIVMLSMLLLDFKAMDFLGMFKFLKKRTIWSLTVAFRLSLELKFD
jgi:hypothetical protein